MKYPRFEKELSVLLQQERDILVQDFVRIFGDMPMPSVYARIRGLVKAKKLAIVGKGRYSATTKPTYRVEVSPWMKQCNEIMVRELEGVDACIMERNGNLEVEVTKNHLSHTVAVLQQHFEKVMYRKDVKWLAEKPKGFVLVGNLVSDAPLIQEDGVDVPAPEKEIVDAICRKETDQGKIQRLMEAHAINDNRLLRYASRRGVAEELDTCLKKVDQRRVDMFSRIQRYLSQTRIVRAWVFGSFARGEETDASDLDLLVEYDKSGGLSLLGIIRYKLDIEGLIGREVDLVENGFIKPFVKDSVEQDKYLIYER